MDLTSTTSDKGTNKTTPRLEGSLGDKDLRGNILPANIEPIPPTVADLLGTGAKYQVDQTQYTRLRYQSLPENKGKPSHEGELDTQPLVLSTYADVRAFLLSDYEAQESEEDNLGAGEEMDEEPQADSIAETHHQSPCRIAYIQVVKNLPTSSYDDDDDEYSFATQEYLKKFSSAITPDLPKLNSLIMEDKHLDSIPETKSDELIKSSDENLVQNQSKSEDEFNPIHNEDLDSTLKNDHFDIESYLLESLLNRNTLMASSPKIDSLFNEFAGEFITIPPRIVNREHEEYISLLERLLYDNLSPRPPEDFHANPNTIIESLPTFPIPVEDSDSLREEIDIFPGPYDLIPHGIESDDYDSEGDDTSTSLLEFESFHVDYLDSRDSTIDVVEDIPIDVPNILPTHPTLHMNFDVIPSHNDLGSDLDVFSPSGDRNKIYGSRICIKVESTRFLATLSPVIDALLPFSSKNEDKVFNHDVLASKEKSPPSSSHESFKASKLFHQKSPMLIHGADICVLDVMCLHFYPLDSLKYGGTGQA
ncbi:hypothetical protein Tco_0895199 [Tanacetum coccineum]|uniref:Reverse transcriptase domain-containing protein n=1 Tax=Tanacetum coccineum TaxID=301880 RepID=A0ABQ5CGT1_9ASTR